MQLYPAIDIKNGKCVRLTQGLFDNVKVYSDNPARVAAQWVKEGATFLHLVDLDGALAGRSVNEDVIRDIVKTAGVPTQLGGGIRTGQAVEAMLSLGVSRVIIGTKAAKHPEFVREMVDAFGADRIVAGVDARDGMVATEGWEKMSQITAVALCQQMKFYGALHIVYTDISRDGMLSGPNVEYTKRLTQETGLDVIASGGVSSMDDLDRLLNAGVKGAIIGKALYEKRIKLPEAISMFE